MRGKQPPLHFEVFASWLREAQVDVLHMHAFTRAIGLYHAEQCKALGIPLVFTVHLPGITCARGTMLHEGRRVCDGKIIVQRCAGCQLQAAGLPALPARVAAVMPPAIARRAVDWPGRMGTLLGMPALIAERTQRLQGLFELADRIVVVAGWLYEVLRRNGVPAEKLLLSRHGLAPQQMTGKHRRERRPERALTVGFIGRFNPIKGAHVLISAMMRLPQHVPVRLRIYGICNDRMEERYMAELQSQAASDGRMSFPGAITAANRAQVFDELDVLAVPSQWLETGPLVALEAFAAGIPVVGSAHGGLTELITPEVNGLLLPPDQPAAWTRALQRLASEDGLLARLSDGVPAVRSSAIVAAEMLDLYRQLRPVASL
jgi:glycosyltransferase involved in cell wall biosynthesis